jgi:RecA-family ATPase
MMSTTEQDWQDFIRRQAEDAEDTAREEYREADAAAHARPVIFDAGLDDAPIPPRGWLLGNVFCRKFLSSLLGGGGSGKTAVRIAQALAMTSGRSLTGEHVFVRCRVLFVCLEDDIDELRRRVRAAMIHYGVKAEDVKGWLFYTAPGRKGGKIVERAGGQLRAGGMVDWLVDDIKRLKIDAAIIDPLVKAHSAVENSNDEMDFVSDTLAQIAHEHDCDIDTPHHVRKGPEMPATRIRDAGRGLQRTAGGWFIR